MAVRTLVITRLLNRFITGCSTVLGFWFSYGYLCSDWCVFESQPCPYVYTCQLLASLYRLICNSRPVTTLVIITADVYPDRQVSVDTNQTSTLHCFTLMSYDVFFFHAGTQARVYRFSQAGLSVPIMFPALLRVRIVLTEVTVPCECVGTLAVTSLTLSLTKHRLLLLGNRRMLLPGTKYS